MVNYPIPLLRSDDAAQGVTARQQDAAMIDLRRRGGGVDRGRSAGEVDDGSATGGAPVGFDLGGNDGVAMAADAFHVSTILYSGHSGTQRAWDGRGSDAGRGWT